ncbi:retrovirus-related pol polyprotein from transposon TNT 1-94 [Tanacetum coccineum]
MYDSWASRIRLFIKGKKHGRMLLDSIDNDDCDVQATNIILHGLPPDVYALVNHQEVAKDIWDRVKLLMKGIELSYQEHKCILYNLFDKFAYVQVQVNTKFLSALPSEWSKFVTNVKLAKSLYTTNYDQFVSRMKDIHILLHCLVVPMFQQGGDLIESINKAMAFLSAVASRFPPSNNQLITSSNPINQATTQDDCDDLSLAKAILMANHSSCDPEVLPECITKEHAVIYVFDDEEILILEEESRSKMLDKQNDPNSIVKKIKISPIDYSKLNKIKKDFGKRFVTQKELSAEQAFCLKHSSFSETPITLHTPVRIEVPSELPKRTTYDAITAGAWGFEHTKACFVTKIIPFLKVLKDTFNSFDKTLLDEITEVQTVFNQMEAAIDQCSVDKNNFEIQIKHLRIDNDKLLKQIMSQQNVHIVVNSVDICDVNMSCVNECTQSQENDTVIRKLKDRIKSLSGKDSLENVKKDIDEIETINIELEHKHCDSLIAQIIAKYVENSDLNAQLQEKVFAITALKNELRKLKGKNIVDNVVSKPNATITQGMFKLDIEPISHRLKNDRDAHEVYIEKTIENTDTLRGFVEHARTQNPRETLLESACMFTKHIQELLFYVSQRCPNSPKPSDKLVVVTPMNKDKRVRFSELVTSSSNISKQIDSLKTKYSNKPLLTSTGVKPTTNASGSKLSGNTKNNKIMRLSSRNQKNKLEDHYRKVKYSLNKMNSISEPISNALVKHSVRNAKFESICVICNKCLFDANHDMCIIDYVNDVNVLGNLQVVQIVLWYLDSGCSNHMTGNRSQLINFVSKFLGTVIFQNDHIAKIMGYGDYQMENITISLVYYVEELGHNLFSVGQFCDSDLEVAFRKHTCFIHDLDGVDLLKGSKGSNLYTMSMDNLLLSSPICLLSKASKTKSWLWHRRLSHLNFDYITSLAKQGLVRGLPKLKYQKDHLCSACTLGKSKKHSHKPKVEDSIQEKLYLLHMDLCGPMRVQSFNGRKYIQVIVDDFSRFTWVKFLRLKDEVPEFVIKFLKMIQLPLNATVCNIRTNNDTEFVNQTLRDYYEEVKILHQTSVARTPQQNGVAKAVATACYTQNRSLIRKHHNKTPYELLHDRKPDLSYLHVFGALCYSTNDGEDLVQDSCQTFLLQLVLAFIAPEHVVSTGTPSSTTIDQDAPLIITSQTPLETPSLVIPLGVKEADHYIEVAHMDNNPSVEFPILEPSTEESST